MKYLYIKIVLFTTAIMLFTSCYQDLDLGIHKSTPIAVLNSIVSTDTVVMASISRTWFYTEMNNNITLKDAKVKLFVNGTFHENLKYTESQSEELNCIGMYLSEYYPAEGDVIKIETETIYGTVSAQDIVPKIVEIENVTTSKRKYSKWGQEYYDITYNISFTDIPNEHNYYFIRIDDAMCNIDYSLEPVFVAQNDNSTGISEKKIYGMWGRHFDDELFNGKKYTLRLREYQISEFDMENDLYKHRKIQLFSISQDYYKYLRSLVLIDESKANDDFANLGISEPLKIFSNITGGTGILGASRLSTYQIKIAE